MSVYVIAEFPFSEKGAEEFIEWSKSDDGYAVTKAWAGFELIQTLLAEDNKTVYLYERWASMKYIMLFKYARGRRTNGFSRTAFRK